MRHLATYLMLVLGGNENPTAEDITNALSKCGIETDPERLSSLISELEGKDVEELIALGKQKLMAGGAGGGGGAPAAAAAAAPSSAPDTGAKEEKKPEKPKEEEVDPLEGGMDMFGGGGGGGDY